MARTGGIRLDLRGGPRFALQGRPAMEAARAALLAGLCALLAGAFALSVARGPGAIPVSAGPAAAPLCASAGGPDCDGRRG